MELRYLTQMFEDDSVDQNNSPVADAAADTEQKQTGQGEKMFTQAEVDAMIEKRAGRMKAQFEQQKASWEKDRTEAQKLSQMSADEQNKAKIAELERKLEDMQKASQRTDMAKATRKVLSENGYADLPDEILDRFVSDDAETTNANVAAFSKYMQDHDAKLTRNLFKGKAPAHGSEPSITKEDIMKVKDTAERQKLIDEHLDLFMKK